MFKNTKTLIENAKNLTDPKSLGLIAFGVVALLVTWSGVKTVQTNFELDKKISVAKQRNEIAQLENDNLKLKNKYYESNQYLELAARSQFGKAVPGERLFIIPEEVALSKTTETPKTEEVQTQEVPKKLYQKNLDAWSKFLFR